LKQFLRHLDNQKGYTLLELLVSSALGLIVVGLGLSAFMSQRRMVDYDLGRTEVHRSLRSSLEIIGINARLAGENLTNSFPAIEVIDGPSGAPDELILRRNIKDEILKLCADIVDGTNDNLFFAIAGTEAGCVRSNQTENFNSWADYLTEQGGVATGYIFDPSTKTGQFFDFTAVTDNGTEMFLQISNTTPWLADYVVGQTAVYIIEEWNFRLSGDVLELIENEKVAMPRQIAFGIENMQVSITLNDDTVVNEFTSAQDWTTISRIGIALTGVKTRALDDIARTQSASYFPRNILSN
jgi:prepilin-type N-terminal cleavage/methylation domain-containing protein